MAVLTRWLGTQPFLGSLLPDMVQIIRYSDWAHLHSFSLPSEWTYKTQCDPALAPPRPTSHCFSEGPGGVQLQTFLPTKKSHAI